MAVSIITSHLQQCDSNGVPLNAGTVTVYAAGTTTPLTLYSDDDLDSGDAITNPITLDSSGRHAMTYIATAAYKLVVKNSAGTTIYTHDDIDPGVAVGSGALPIANGGTAGTTAAAARTNLGAAAASDVATIQSDISNLNEHTGYNATDSTSVAVGTTAQRPGSPAAGMIRRNSTNSVFEAYGSSWSNLLTGDAAATQSNLQSETNEVTFARPDRMKYSPGVAKAWAKVTFSGGTPSLAAAYNVSSITDNGAGNTTLNFTNAMATSDYAVSVVMFGVNAAVGLISMCEVSAMTTSGVTIKTYNPSASNNVNTVAVDFNYFAVVYGTLA